VPVRMVNEYVYCPRLAFLEWVDSEWADSGDTEEGRWAHARVDAGGGKLPVPAEIDDKPDFVARSVTLASERLGIIGSVFRGFRAAASLKHKCAHGLVLEHGALPPLSREDVGNG
jgi:hypothetical protein